jgi:hypothetical protein
LVSFDAKQFEVWRLGAANEKQARMSGMVLVLQSNRYIELPTAIVAPIFQKGVIWSGNRIRPEIKIDDDRYAIAFDQIAVIARNQLSRLVQDVSSQEWAFKAALDELFF